MVPQVSRSHSACPNLFLDTTVAVLADFSAAALKMMSSASGRRITTLREGLRICRPCLSKNTANKAVKLGFAYAVARHLTREYVSEVLAQLDRDLVGVCALDCKQGLAVDAFQTANIGEHTCTAESPAPSASADDESAVQYFDLSVGDCSLHDAATQTVSLITEACEARVSREIFFEAKIATLGADVGDDAAKLSGLPDAFAGAVDTRSASPALGLDAVDQLPDGLVDSLWNAHMALADAFGKEVQPAIDLMAHCIDELERPAVAMEDCYHPPLQFCTGGTQRCLSVSPARWARGIQWLLGHQHRRCPRARSQCVR